MQQWRRGASGFGISVVTVLAVVGCGGSSGSADAAANELVYHPCADATRVGGFQVILADEYTGVQGQIFDAVAPSSVVDVLASVGSCRQVRVPVRACDPVCSGGESCGVDEQCAPSASAHSVGEVTVRGLAAAVEMSPNAATNYYTYLGTLPHPGFAAEAALTLDAAGGDYAGFRLRGWGISALVTDQTEVAVESGAAVELSWAPPPAPGPARVRISLVVNDHGLVGSNIECEADDTGAFTIPEPLITALLDDGLSGFPTIALVRASIDSIELEPGCVDFRVESTRVLDVAIPGLISCTDDDDCPEGQTCQADLRCE